MTRVLVVHHDIDTADQEVDSLRRAGYEVTECIGPSGAARPCPVLRGSDCQLADGADVLVYDVFASGVTGNGAQLIEHLREQYPDKPIVLTSTGMALDWDDVAEDSATITVVGPPDRARLTAAIERAVAVARV
jgi:CheY-like chemotaxis protein